MITSAENRSWPGDIPIGPAFRDVGLPIPSVIRACKIATIEARNATRIGQIDPTLLAEVLDDLERGLGLTSARASRRSIGD